jgi:TolB-like protein
MDRWTPQTTLGPYVLLEPIGSGGMGEVWKARDTRLDRTVAIKRLKPEHSDRFDLEARAIAALNHPHICQIHDVGPDYLVLEFVEGVPLRGPLPADDVLRLGLQMASALEDAHAAGIFHRDLKPDNILLTRKGSIKLLDFGIAKLTVNEEAATRLSGVVGTPLYMSPEQAEGDRVEASSDIFSLGAVLYELCTGRRAFDSLASLLRDEPAPFEAPTPLRSVILRCLRKRSTDRYRDARELRVALEQLTTAAAEGRPSVAVLPFVKMSADQEQEYFSDGLAEDVINALARAPSLKVTARTSSQAVSLRAAGRDEEAANEARQVLDINPQFVAAYTLQALDVTAVGPDEALAYAERGMALAPFSRSNVGLLAGVLWRQGQKARAREVIASLDTTVYDAPAALAIFHALRDQPEEAANWFDRAIDRRHPFVSMIFLTPPYLPVLRASSRWPMLVRRLNLSETH